jgi:hypothetical protein
MLGLKQSTSTVFHAPRYSGDAETPCATTEAPITKVMNQQKLGLRQEQEIIRPMNKLTDQYVPPIPDMIRV